MYIFFVRSLDKTGHHSCFELTRRYHASFKEEVEEGSFASWKQIPRVTCFLRAPSNPQPITFLHKAHAEATTRTSCVLSTFLQSACLFPVLLPPHLILPPPQLGHLPPHPPLLEYLVPIFPGVVDPLLVGQSHSVVIPLDRPRRTVLPLPVEDLPLPHALVVEIVDDVVQILKEFGDRIFRRGRSSAFAPAPAAAVVRVGAHGCRVGVGRSSNGGRRCDW
mmetsp:Transcript_59967/g.177811  ORF Transcript_59967/g.177811 Transcript_59967/m.177811 type:complete len:220 (+) Transcript_59967:139-798(+)